MSGTITFSAGQIFSGGSTVGGGAVGTVAFTQTGSVSYDLASDPPTVSDLTITKDEAASSASFDSLVVQSVSIESVSTKIVTLNTADLPGTAGIPPGLSLNVTGTLLDVAVVTNGGTFYGTAAEYGTDGDLALVAVDEISVYGFPVNVGAAVLSLGVQTTGSVDETFTPAFTVSCFATGTSIRTARGDVPVEHLAIGDRLALRHGGTAPLVWLGHRDVDCRRHPAPRSVWPVRVRRDAFGPGLPARDLLLSPDHAVFCDGVLIPVRHLLNGTSIVQEARDTVTYWHVELGRHDVIFAEALPCESYLDTGTRSAFANAGTPMQLHPDFAARAWDGAACAPLVTAGPQLDAVRALLHEAARHEVARAVA